MKLKTYIRTSEAGTARTLAEKLGVSPSFLSQLASGKNISPARAVEIERLTDGLVSRKDMRPDDWHLIWPELIAVPPSPTFSETANGN